MFQHTSARRCVAAFLLWITAAGPPGLAKIIYVDKAAPGDENGTHDGTTWEKAYLELRDVLPEGIPVAQPCDQVWVATGTYKPFDCTPPCSLFDRQFGNSGQPPIS